MGQIDPDKKITLNVSEAAALLGISRPLVYQLMNRDDFPAFKIGSRTVISRELLDEWVKKQVNG